MAEDTKRAKLADRIGQFVAVPVTFINDTRISARAFRLFVVLRSYTSASNGDDAVFPGYQTLRERCGVSNFRFIAEALRELETLGWIERKKRFGRSTIYALNPTPVLHPSVVMDTDASTTPVCSTVLHPSVASVLHPLVEELEVLNQKEKNPEVERAPRKKRAVSGFSSVYTSHDDPRVAAYLEILARKQITATDAEIIQKRVSTDTSDVWREALGIFAANPSWRLDLASIIDRYERMVNAKRFTSKTDAPNYQNGAYKNAKPWSADGAMEILRARAAARGETI
jgi:hypothetical protein